MSCNQVKTNPLFFRLSVLFCGLPLIAWADSVVVFNEIMYHPATNEAACEWVELHNQNAVDVELSGWRLTGGIDYTFADGTILSGGGDLVVAISPANLRAAGVTNVVGPFTGRLANGGEVLNLRDLSGRLMDTLHYGTDGEWPVGPDGSGVSLAKRHPDLASSSAANWTVSRQMGGTPGVPNFPVVSESYVVVTTNLTLVPYGATWRHYSGDPGTGWNQVSFDDGDWEVDTGPLGYETNNLPLPLATALTLGETAYYFRTTFNYTNNPAEAALNVTHLVDDGLVVYLNGVEVLRTGMPEGEITPATLASRGVGDAALEGPFTLPTASLVGGMNVLAVEVHQTTTNSSDIVFGLRLNERQTVGVVTNAAGVPPLTGPTTNLVSLDGTWRFDDSGVDQGIAWRNLSYDDSAWGFGPGLFFVEEAPLPGPKNTPLTPGRNTYYFRHVFNFEGDPGTKLFDLRSLVDDGAIVYLNGAEIARLNMPTGTVSYATMASTAVPDASFTGPLSVASSNLVEGQNVLAVELHQSTSTSNPGLRVLTAANYVATWDGADGDYFSEGSPALAPANAALASQGVEVFASSNPNLAVGLNDGHYGAEGAWNPAASDPAPFVVLRFNQILPISSIAWSRDNGDTAEAACGGTCMDRSLGNYTFQYTLAPDPAVVVASSSNPTNGWATIATVQHLSAEPGFSPYLRHRYDLSRISAEPILATGVRLRVSSSCSLDEIEINTPSLASFDAVFGLELTATDLLPPPPPFVFNELSQASATLFWLEIINAGDTPQDLAGVRVVGSGGGFAYEFPSLVLAPGGITVVPQAQLGFGAVAGDKLYLYAPGGFNLLDAVTVQATPQGRRPDGAGEWMIPNLPTPGGSNLVFLNEDLVINEIMYHYPPTDASPAVTSNLNVIAVNGNWRYEDSGTDLGTAWREPGYDDSSWPTGSGLLGVNNGSLPAPVGTTLAADRGTYYFRTRFDFNGGTNLSLSLRSIVDDGAVFYLNGVEILRQGMPAGLITYETSASAAVGDAGFVETLDLPADVLVLGVNVLAVEVHQATAPTAIDGIVLNGGGLTLVEEGPFDGTPPMNLARQPGAAPFVIDSLAGYPNHNFVGLTDGVYGNGNSWIGNSGNPGFAGVSFGGLFTISGLAFGRDNLGAYTDRALGVYTLQYTRVASPGTGTSFTGNPDTGWATIGTLNYQRAGGGLFANPSRRHRFKFDPVDATGIRLLVPGTGIGGGTCIDELEVNPPDTSGDVAFGAQLALTTTLVPAEPFRASDEEWIELYNRGADAIDLSQWSLAGTVDFLFPTGVVVAPDGYLVIARDAITLRAKWPEVAAQIIGDFSGRLHDGDTLMLQDAVGNAVDRIRIHERGFSDGGGSSVELIDPRADNAQADAWRGSDESSHSEWQTVVYRMIAGQRFGSSLWNEFRFGLLDSGEVLVDDVSVVQDPDGSAQQLIQNGGFETTTGNVHWRWLGSHQESRIITDPDNPANNVLEISASAPARSSHNHVETSFLANTPLVDGQEYEVSFRARWLRGSSLIHSSAYHQRLARATALKLPSRLGTPGAPNSTRIPNAGPTFEGLAHVPVIPQPNEPVTVSVRIDDPDQVGSATLYYRVNPTLAFTSIPMVAQSSGAWEGTIPGQAIGKVVQFYVVAEDGLGATTFAPSGGPDSRALYQVVDTQGTALSAHELRLIQLDTDRDFMLMPTNVISQGRVGGTVIYDESEVFYDVGVRLRGTAASRARDGDAYISFNIQFPSTHLFRGVHGSVGIDRAGRAPVVGHQDEIYILHMFERAGLPVHHTDLCYFISPQTLYTGTAILQLGGYDGTFVDEQYGVDGSTFNFDITYEPSATVDGDFEGIKLPVPLQPHILTDMQDLGDDKEQYRVPFSLRTGERRDDFTGIMRLCKAMGAPQPQFDADIGSALDVEEALRVTALTILCGIGDIYFSATPALPHNCRIYTPADGGAAQFLPWDMDFVFTQSATASIFPTSTYNISKFMNNPATRRFYLSQVQELLDTVFNPTYMTPWLERYGNVVGQDYSSASAYITSRSNSARSQLPAEVPFDITSNSGEDFAAETNYVMLTGNGWLDIREIEVNDVPYPVNWTGDTAWSLKVPLAEGANLLRVQAVDLTGNRRTDLVDTITVTNSAPAALRPVVINEWMADNAGPGGMADPVDGLFQDWFELFNPNATSVDLSGYYLTDDLAQPTKWAIPTNTIIAGRGFLLVWADEDGSQNSPTNADLHANFKLSTGGEALGLFAPDGYSPQHAIVFGPQSENVSQGLFPDGAVGSIHFMTNWTPRASNRLDLPAAPEITAFVVEAGTMTLTFSAVPGRSYRLEYKEDLNTPVWTPVGNTWVAASAILTLNEQIEPGPQRFFRVRME